MDDDESFALSLESFKNGILDLRMKNLTRNEAKILSNALVLLPSEKKIIPLRLLLSYNNFTLEGLVDIASALENCNVAFLGLGCNDLGNDGAKVFAELLKKTHRLQVLIYIQMKLVIVGLSQSLKL